MRLVVLAALLRQICAAQRAAKVVLFMSSCDAVEFVHQMFSEVFELVDGEPLLPTTIFKLHGNLAQVRTWQSAKTQAGLMMACVCLLPKECPVSREASPSSHGGCLGIQCLNTFSL